MNKFIAIICALMAGIGSLSAATGYKGDINNDGKVDLADMVALATAINESKADKNLHDLNASGSVDDTDLRVLADIILSEKLIEDTGFNIGIGGWEDGGEDFGGEVSSVGPTGNVLSYSSELSFFISDALYDNELFRKYVNIGISSLGQVCGVLFEIRHDPNDLSYDITKDLTVNYDGGPVDGYGLYGTPIIMKEERTGWKRLRFIVFSPDLKSFHVTDGTIVKFYYTGHSNSYSGVQLKNCQTISANATVATYHPESPYFFIDCTDMSGVNEIIADAEEMDIYNINGNLLKAKTTFEYLNQLAPGFYIIVTSGKTLKYLK